MQARLVLSILATGVVAMGAHQAAAQNRTAALTGQVTSDAEGKMEGVVVSARKVGSPVTSTPRRSISSSPRRSVSRRR
jgi:hypothetical protein